jgi:two-component system, OmpR family, sensor histidine kinase ResE
MKRGKSLKYSHHPWSISIKLWAAMTTLILVVLGGLGAAITLLFGDFYLQQKLGELGNDAKEISIQLSQKPNWAERLVAIENIRLPSDTQMVIMDKTGEIISVKGDNVPNGAGNGMGWGNSGLSGNGMGWWYRSVHPTDFLTASNISEVLEGNIITIKALPKNQSGQAMLVAAAPLGNPGDAIIALGSSPAPVQESTEAFQRIILYSSLVAVFLATIVSLIFARQVTRPLALMQKGASRMAGGDFQPITGVKSRDELGQLAEALNSMGESLSNHVTWLSQEKDLLQGIVEGISDAVIMLDAKGEILYTNEPAKALWQGNSKDAMERKDKIIAFLREFASKSNLEGDINLTLDTQVLHVAMASTQAREEERGFVAVLRDVTSSLRAEKERRDFMASVTHELRTPLHLIQGYLEAIQDEVIPKEEQAEHIDLVLDEARRLAKLVMELQDINRLERWQMLEKKEMDIGIFLQELNYRFQGKAEEMGINLEIEEGSGVIQADRDRLLQVFINLIDNALRHTPSGKNVRIKVQTEEKNLQFIIEDEGEGIPPQALPHIFDRFYRVDKSRSRKEGGMGLGLAIVKQIVEAHGGEISVVSQPGNGTSFYVILPI